MKKYADINFNGDFWRFVPLIGIKGFVTYPEQQINLVSNVGLMTIAESLLKSLNKSKTLQPSDPEFENFPPKFLDYDDWVKDIMQKYGYKSEAAIYRNMQSCSAILEDKVIAISPSNHNRTRGWEGMDKSFDLTISSDSSPEVIGAAVKYSIARCTGKGADLVAKKLFPDGVPETFDDYLASLSLKLRA